MLSELLKSYKLVLASQSPRRHELLSSMDLDFEVRKIEVEEDFSNELKRAEVAEFLAEKKFAAAEHSLAENEILITADTIVCLADSILNKPESEEEAFQMLQTLSGNEHEVITAVCLGNAKTKMLFHDKTLVRFGELSYEEIEYYIRQFPPYDKAGGYGIQDWIGCVGIDWINGSFFNVMGLPTRKLYVALKNFLLRK